MRQGRGIPLSSFDTIDVAVNVLGISPTRRKRRAPVAGDPLVQLTQHREVPPPPAMPGSNPVVFGITPVAGTAAAQAAEALKIVAAKSRPHILLDPNLATRPADPKVRIPKGMRPVEIADSIVATILQGSGPILLCVPGTLGVAYQSSMLTTARAVIDQAGGGPISIASVPYPNGIKDIVTRFFNIGIKPADNVLALILKKLKQLAPHRPILLTGESQGAWLIADTLRTDPSLAAAVTRVALFAKPGFVKLPGTLAAARMGAHLLPESHEGATGLVEWKHTDDIVPSLFTHLGLQVVGGFAQAIEGWAQTGNYEYAPHHYDPHGAEAATWLLTGERPTNPQHHSRIHSST